MSIPQQDWGWTDVPNREETEGDAAILVASIYQMPALAAELGVTLVWDLREIMTHEGSHASRRHKFVLRKAYESEWHNIHARIRERSHACFTDIDIATGRMVAGRSAAAVVPVLRLRIAGLTWWLGLGVVGAAFGLAGLARTRRRRRP